MHVKHIFIMLFVFAVCVLAIRFVAGEDDWICKRAPASASDSGEARWVKHGQPSSSMPKEACK